MIKKRRLTSMLWRNAAFLLGGSAVLSGCELAPNQQAESSDPGSVARVSSALTTSGGGFRILADGDPTYGLNAYGGARDGGPVQLWQGCGKDNPDCRWSYREGMLVSATDPRLAIKGAGDWAGLTLSAACTPDDPTCLWAWNKGKLLNVSTNFGINAYGSPHQPNPSPIVSTSACTNGESNPDCTWTLESVSLASGADPRLQIYAGDAPGNATPVSLKRDCPVTDTRCTWTLKQGMFTSDYDSSLSINAWGGAAVGTNILLANNCTPSNGDCRWQLMTTTGGGYTGSNIQSDNPDSGSTLVMVPTNGALAGSPIKLADTGGSSPECRAGYLGNPACAFEAGPLTVAYSGPPAKAEWTLIYFMFGETSFAWDSMDLIGRYGTAGSTDSVNIIVVLDTPNAYTPASRLGPAYAGDGVELRINRNADPTVIQDMGEINMADPVAMGQIGSSIVSTFPANRYGVVMYDHGGGWSGFGYDAEPNIGVSIATGATNGGNYGAYGQILSSMAQTLTTKGLGQGGTLDLVVINACLMGEWEVAAATAPYAKYYVASEQEIYGDPWASTTFLPQLVAQPTMSAGAFGTTMVNTYYPGQPTGDTLSNINLSSSYFGTTGSLTTAIDSLGRALQNPPLYDCIRAARASSIGFADSSGQLRDLYDLAAKLQASTATGGACPNAAIYSAAGAVMQATTASVVSRTSSGVAGAPSGLTIFMPDKCTQLDPNYYQGAGAVWSQQTHWDEFLRGFAPPASDLTASGTPFPPASLSATTGANNSVTLTWPSSSTYGVTYSILRGTSSGSHPDVRASGLTSTTFVDTGTAGTTYYYVVTAQVCGATATSSEVKFTVPNDPCAGLCYPPVVKTGPSIQSGNLGTGAICQETTATLSGGNCSNMTGRTLTVNGTAVNCNGWTLPAKRNNGYCVQVTSGGLSYASYATW